MEGEILRLADKFGTEVVARKVQSDDETLVRLEFSNSVMSLVFKKKDIRILGQALMESAGVE